MNAFSDGAVHAAAARRLTGERAIRMRCANVENLISNRDSHAKRLVRFLTAEYAERQILYREITVNPIRGVDPARQPGIMGRIEFVHGVVASGMMDVSSKARADYGQFFAVGGAKFFFKPCQHSKYSACNCDVSSACRVGLITQRVSNMNAIVSRT